MSLEAVERIQVHQFKMVDLIVKEGGSREFRREKMEGLLLRASKEQVHGIGIEARSSLNIDTPQLM